MTPKLKWKFAIGTTSRVPDSGGRLHYLIADFDDPLINQERIWLELGAYREKAIIQDTEHGWHLYTSWKMTFDELIPFLKKISADPEWVRIGERRGYLFLADKKEINFPWPVEHMVIKYGKKETQNTRRA